MPLAGVTDVALIAAAVVQALDVRVRAGESAEDAVVEFLAGRGLLLVADNMEQLLEGAPLVSRLLAAAPGLKVLVTSRSVLRLTGEHEVAVPPLDAAEKNSRRGHRGWPKRTRTTRRSARSAFVSRGYRSRSSSPPHA